MNWKEQYRNALLDKTANPPDIRAIVNPHIPSKLYKYGSFESPYWEKVVYKAMLYLSPAKNFNDPFDCRANFDYNAVIKTGKFREALLKFYPQCDEDEFSEEIVQKYIIEGMREDVFVFCFSEIWNSLLMWAHYANNYNGYCLEYDIEQMKDIVTDNLYPVLYEKEYIDITENLIYMNKNTGLISNLAKAEEWSYEKEWRIVRYNNQPFYARRQLRAVYLGNKCRENDKEAIIKWAKENGKKVFLITPSEKCYELEAHRIL